jgi:hypothetical protein
MLALNARFEKFLICVQIKKNLKSIYARIECRVTDNAQIKTTLSVVLRIGFYGFFSGSDFSSLKSPVSRFFHE